MLLVHRVSHLHGGEMLSSRNGRLWEMEDRGDLAVSQVSTPIGISELERGPLRTRCR